MALTVKDIMQSQPVAVSHETPVTEALRVMIDGKINSVVVCRRGAVDGIFTPRDLLDRGDDQWSGKAVSELMTPEPVTISAGETFADAAKLMDETGVRHLPVLEAGKLVGMVSMRDLMQHRTQELERVVRRQTADLEARNAELAERNRLMHYHLEIAGRIQRQVLPTSMPRLEPFSLAASFHPLDRVSGDCYDLVVLTPDRLGILIADACGHGVPAAFVSVMARTIFQAYGRAADSPSSVLRMMNEQLPCLIEEEHFITMCYATVDRQTLRMTYATAGHPTPLWYRHREDVVEPLEGGGHVIGVLEDPDFEDRTIQLEPNDAVLFFTDGVFECRNEAGECFGRDRITAVLQGNGDHSSDRIVESLDAELRRFCGQRGFGDDVTSIALSTTGRWEPVKTTRA